VLGASDADAANEKKSYDELDDGIKKKRSRSCGDLTLSKLLS